MMFAIGAGATFDELSTAKPAQTQTPFYNRSLLNKGGNTNARGARTDAARMREEDLEVALKVVIVGDGGVGKSSMIQRYCRGTFTRDYKKTIGVDFLERQIEIDGEEVRLMLWDTAGQEEFDAITKAYYRGAHACVLAFSTTDRDSFLALHSWKLKDQTQGTAACSKSHSHSARVGESTMRPQYILVAVAFALGAVECRWSHRSEEKCIDYYRTGENFDLEQMNGVQWRAVYFWPPIQRERESCGVLNFRTMADDELEAETVGCEDLVDENDTVVRATYRNSTGKLVSVVYYGNEEVKHLMRSCDKVYKYIFIRINEDYVAGINCSAGGRGVLLAKYLPSYDEVENECGEIPTIIVQNKIDLMDQCVVGPDEAELVARALGCRLMRASVKEDVNVGAVFRALAARCLAEMRRDDAADAPPPANAPVIGTFTNHNSNGTILLRPAKHRPGGKKKNVLRNACRLL
ncbi:unnamed protein product, partial [Iphiclides podalirius]